MDEVDRVLDAAKELMDLNYYREALALLKEASTRYPDEPDIFYFMGCCALNERNGEEAFFYYSVANELCPEDADILSGLSDASLTMERNDMAARFIGEALRVEPDSINAQISFGHFL
jgi:tetratricopeptide (TPR) repeat protein